MEEPWETLSGAKGTQSPPCEIEERLTSPVGYLTGFAGALVGALVGAVPWFLASTFANFFIGWLGFFVGLAACWGYRTCRGARQTGYAMAVIILCSILAIVLSDFASNMYTLCTDPDWQRAARHMGISVYDLAARSLRMQENLGVILPNLLIGLLIGGLGVFSARNRVVEYTDPERAAKLRAAGAPAFQQTLAGPMLRAGPASTGLPLPQSFTLQLPKFFFRMSYVCFALAGVFFLLFLALSAFAGWEGMAIGLVLCLFITAEGVLIRYMNRRFRLEVNGERLRFVSRIGKAREFTASDIASVSVPDRYRRILYDQNHQVLAKVPSNMENVILLNQYLAEHEIPLRG